MNTLGGTDEGRARPSVWPVYVAAGVIGLLSVQLWYSAFGLLVLAYTPYAICPALSGFFGFLTSWGLVRLRPWGWWCAVVWSIIFIALFGFVFSEAPHLNLAAIIVYALIARLPVPLMVTAAEITRGVTNPSVRWSAFIILVVVPLATRRRLFFPPKPEGEE